MEDGGPRIGPPIYAFRRHQHMGRPFTLSRDALVPEWRLKERMKTCAGALIMCLNIGVNPPGVVRTEPYAKTECGIDPYSMPPHKALDMIGRNLQKQYEQCQPQARYRLCLDPVLDDVKRVCLANRRHARKDRVLVHYNGHGVPFPTGAGEIWVFDKGYTQYIPLSVFDLQTYAGTPSLYVFDSSGAGALAHFFENASASHGKEGSAQESICLFACKADQMLPVNPDLPADVFSSCLTNPIEIAVKWFLLNNFVLRPSCPFNEIFSRIPGPMSHRKSPLGELNWVFTATTDSIAWKALPPALFQKLFRQDLLVASLFRNFFLAERIMRCSSCTPFTFPRLPPTYKDPWWSAWDQSVDQLVSQFAIPSPTLSYHPLSFFAQQLNGFEVWLSFGSSIRRAPDQLPVLLQVLLSQAHRVRALALLAKFLDLGPWAVALALNLGIHPYIVKLLQSNSLEVRLMLTYIWAKLLVVEPSCQQDLIREGGHKYFLQVLASGLPQELQLGSAVDEQRAAACSILASICCGSADGQAACFRSEMVSRVGRFLCYKHAPTRLWAVLGLAKLADGLPAAQLQILSDSVRPAGSYSMAAASSSAFEPAIQGQVPPKISGERILLMLGDSLAAPHPEIRAGAIYAISCLISSIPFRQLNAADMAVGHGTPPTPTLSPEEELVAAVLVMGTDSSPLVRREVLHLISVLFEVVREQVGIAACLLGCGVAEKTWSPEAILREVSYASWISSKGGETSHSAILARTFPPCLAIPMLAVCCLFHLTSDPVWEIQVAGSTLYAAISSVSFISLERVLELQEALKGHFGLDSATPVRRRREGKDRSLPIQESSARYGGVDIMKKSASFVRRPPSVTENLESAAESAPIETTGSLPDGESSRKRSTSQEAKPQWTKRLFGILHMDHARSSSDLASTRRGSRNMADEPSRTPSPGILAGGAPEAHFEMPFSRTPPGRETRRTQLSHTQTARSDTEALPPKAITGVSSDEIQGLIPRIFELPPRKSLQGFRDMEDQIENAIAGCQSTIFTFCSQRLALPVFKDKTNEHEQAVLSANTPPVPDCDSDIDDNEDDVSPRFVGGDVDIVMGEAGFGESFVGRAPSLSNASSVPFVPTWTPTAKGSSGNSAKLPKNFQHERALRMKIKEKRKDLGVRDDVAEKFHELVAPTVLLVEKNSIALRVQERARLAEWDPLTPSGCGLCQPYSFSYKPGYVYAHPRRRPIHAISDSDRVEESSFSSGYYARFRHSRVPAVLHMAEGGDEKYSGNASNAKVKKDADPADRASSAHHLAAGGFPDYRPEFTAWTHEAARRTHLPYWHDAHRFSAFAIHGGRCWDEDETHMKVQAPPKFFERPLDGVTAFHKACLFGARLPADNTLRAAAPQLMSDAHVGVDYAPLHERDLGGLRIARRCTSGDFDSLGALKPLGSIDSVCGSDSYVRLVEFFYTQSLIAAVDDSDRVSIVDFEKNYVVSAFRVGSETSPSSASSMRVVNEDTGRPLLVTGSTDGIVKVWGGIVSDQESAPAVITAFDARTDRLLELMRVRREVSERNSFARVSSGRSILTSLPACYAPPPAVVGLAPYLEEQPVAGRARTLCPIFMDIISGGATGDSGSTREVQNLVRVNRKVLRHEPPPYLEFAREHSLLLDINVMGPHMLTCFGDGPPRIFLHDMTYEHPVSVWRVPAFEELNTDVSALTLCVDQSPAGVFATGCSNGCVYLFDPRLSTGCPVLSFKAHTDGDLVGVSRPLLFPHVYVTAASDGTMRFWDLRKVPDSPVAGGDLSSQGCYRSIRSHHERITALSCHPHAPIVSSGSADNFVELFSLSGAPITSYDCNFSVFGEEGRVSCIAFHPYEILLAVGSTRDGSLTMFGSGESQRE